MRNEDWSATRIAAALAKLEDAGHSQPAMARLAGVSQSTVNRWSRGKVQPGYTAVRKLAVALWRKQPELARELVEASGYPWAEPTEAPQPPPIPPEVLDYIRNSGRYDREQQEYLIETLLDPTGPEASQEGRSEPGGASRRAG